MNKLESIKEALAEYKADEDLLSPPERGYLEDVEYLLQRLERYEKALEWYADESNYDIDDVTTDCEKKAQEALKEP